MLVLGTGPGVELLGQQLAARDGHAPRAVEILGGDPSDIPPGWLHAGPIEALNDRLESGEVSEVAICLAESEWANAERLIRACLTHGVGVWIPVATPTTLRRSRLQVSIKRVLDVTGALVGLAILSPLLAVAAIAIALDDGRPVLFRQHRAGLRGRPFTILKYRTMERDAHDRRAQLRADSEVSGGASFKLSEDPRVTRLGRLLRRASIDELPQLWNVLVGEMSLVGPRPHPYDDLAGYRTWHMGRLAVKPGITGLWQVELRNDPDFDRWVAKDIEYIERWSLWLDLRILAKTIPAVLRGSGR